MSLEKQNSDEFVKKFVELHVDELVVVNSSYLGIKDGAVGKLVGITKSNLMLDVSYYLVEILVSETGNFADISNQTQVIWKSVGPINYGRTYVILLYEEFTLMFPPQTAVEAVNEPTYWNF